MKRLFTYSILIFLFSILFLGCGNSSEEVEAQSDVDKTGGETPIPSPTVTIAPSITPAPTETQVPTSTATEEPTLTPTLGIGSTQINVADNAILIYVPGRRPIKADLIFREVLMVHISSWDCCTDREIICKRFQFAPAADRIPIPMWVIAAASWVPLLAMKICRRK